MVDVVVGHNYVDIHLRVPVMHSSDVDGLDCTEDKEEEVDLGYEGVACWELVSKRRVSISRLVP
jgi:hypothetical protein